MNTITQTINVCRDTATGDECWHETYQVDLATLPTGQRTYTVQPTEIDGIVTEFVQDGVIVFSLWIVSALLFVALRKKTRV